MELALQAGRTSNPQVFAALALDTAYPSRHYPERAFHQLVLKALGMGLDVGRLMGLTQRQGVTLNQLALDLLDEQLAAERTVSPGLPTVIAFDLAVVRALAHDIMVIKDGHVLERGATQTIFDAPQHPYTQQLLAAAFTVPAS